MVTRERRQESRQTRLGGIGNVVAAEIEDRIGRETRVMVLGHLQHGGSPSTLDRVLASTTQTSVVTTSESFIPVDCTLLDVWDVCTIYT